MSYTRINGIPVYGKNLVRYLGLLKINPARDLRVPLPHGEWFVHCPQCKGLGFEIIHYDPKKRTTSLPISGSFNWRDYRMGDEFMTEIPCSSCHLKGYLDLRSAIELDFEIMNHPNDITLEDSE